MKRSVSILYSWTWSANLILLLFLSLSSDFVRAQNDSTALTELREKLEAFKAQDQLDSILFYQQKAFVIATRINYKPGIAEAYGTFGLVWKMKGDYPKALQNMYKALHLYETQGNSIGALIQLGNIGTVYDMQGDFQKALDYYFKALKISMAVNDKKYIANQYRNIAIAYSMLQNTKEAEKYYFKALKIDEVLNDQKIIATDLLNLGNLYSDNGALDKSLTYCLKALAIFKKLGYEREIAQCLINISAVYMDMSKDASAEDYLLQAIPLVEKMQDKGSKAELENIISQIYSELGKDRLALQFYKKYIALRDSVYSEENTRQSIKAEMNYEFQKKQAAVKFENDKIIYKLEAQNKLNKQWRIFLILFIVLVLFLLYFAKRSSDNKKKYAKFLSLENERKELLLQEVHHRVNNSLQMISSLLAFQADSTDNEEVREYLVKTENRILAMSSMHELLHEDNTQLEVDISKYIGKMLVFYKKLLEASPQISLETNIPEVTFPSKIALPVALIVNELITNAIKYAFPDNRAGAINISLYNIEEDREKWMLKVCDNGIGLPGQNTKVRNSLGLRLVNIMSRQIGGTLTTSNEHGTCFELAFSKKLSD